MNLQFGVSVFPQYTTWKEMRDVGVRIEELGYDSLWTWDHYLPIFGDPNGANLEGWQILAAWGALTSRIHIGALVSGNTYRHPAVLANMGATLDHITNGRAILGLGAGWFELEHKQYGLDFDTAGVRLAKMDEAAHIIRSLLDHEATSHEGKYYQLQEARCEPKPLQKRLPIMIGGGGEKKTLRTVARYADQWNGMGEPDQVAHKLAILRQHCADVKRNFDDILPTVLLRVVVRDHPADVEKQMQDMAVRNHIKAAPTSGAAALTGSPHQVAQGIFEYYKVGVRSILLGLPTPYDYETLERVATEVRPAVQELIKGTVARR